MSQQFQDTQRGRAGSTGNLSQWPLRKRAEREEGGAGAWESAKDRAKAAEGTSVLGVALPKSKLSFCD